MLKVERVFHRTGAIWPFTVVGRPPQEDTVFGQLIHELTGPIIPTVVPGVRAVHAVDAAGVHPLLLAIGSERYTPYADPARPQELLTQANAILGQGQLSLAKYLLIVNGDDDPALGHSQHRSVSRPTCCAASIGGAICIFRPARRSTRSIIPAARLNEGSKVVIAAAGPVRRELPTKLPSEWQLPEGFHNPRVCLPGVVAISGPRVAESLRDSDAHLGETRPPGEFCSALQSTAAIDQFPLIVVVDDSDFTAQSLNNFLWVTFTRSNPAADIDGVGAFCHEKHWGCAGPLVIDARRKPHHAPPLEPDAEVSRRVDRLFAAGGPLAGII